MCFGSVATPAPLAHRRIGCVGDNFRLAALLRRCGKACALHLCATWEVIRAAAELSERRDTVVVLGSGLLDDVPLADLSGSFALLLKRAERLQLVLPPLCAAMEVDLVVSINLLSQPPIWPVERLENSAHTFGAWWPDETDTFGRAIVDGHLAELPRLPTRVCLVADLEKRKGARGGSELSRLDLLYGARLRKPDQPGTGSSARSAKLPETAG